MKKEKYTTLFVNYTFLGHEAEEIAQKYSENTTSSTHANLNSINTLNSLSNLHSLKNQKGVLSYSNLEKFINGENQKGNYNSNKAEKEIHSQYESNKNLYSNRNSSQQDLMNNYENKNIINNSSNTLEVHSNYESNRNILRNNPSDLHNAFDNKGILNLSNKNGQIQTNQQSHMLQSPRSVSNMNFNKPMYNTIKYSNNPNMNNQLERSFGDNTINISQSISGNQFHQNYATNNYSKNIPNNNSKGFGHENALHRSSSTSMISYNVGMDNPNYIYKKKGMSTSIDFTKGGTIHYPKNNEISSPRSRLEQIFQKYSKDENSYDNSGINGNKSNQKKTSSRLSSTGSSTNIISGYAPSNLNNKFSSTCRFSNYMSNNNKSTHQVPNPPKTSMAKMSMLFDINKMEIRGNKKVNKKVPALTKNSSMKFIGMPSSGMTRFMNYGSPVIYKPPESNTLQERQSKSNYRHNPAASPRPGRSTSKNMGSTQRNYYRGHSLNRANSSSGRIVSAKPSYYSKKNF